MPYISAARYAELVHLENAVRDIQPHVDRWIELLEAHVGMLPPDGPLGSGDAQRSFAQHELRAMKRDLGALFPAVALNED